MFGLLFGKATIIASTEGKGLRCHGS